MIPREACAGCRDDFYNSGNNPYDIKRCWSAETGEMKPYLLIHINDAPPYDKRMAKLRPSCYRKPQFVKVSPEALNTQGYWK